MTVEIRARSRADNLHFTAFRFGVVAAHAATPRSPRRRAPPPQAETALVFVGRSGEWDTEGSDLDGIALPGRQDELVAAVLAANPRTVVVLQTGGPVELPWMAQRAGDPAGLVSGPGMRQRHRRRAVRRCRARRPAAADLPQGAGATIPTWSQDREVYPGLDGKVRYEEGVFIGYRHYDRQGIAPMFAFGHGLGYTTFDLGDLSAEPQSDGGVIALRLRFATPARAPAALWSSSMSATATPRCRGRCAN